ncbi:hypothetical protein CAPTEDRAFT_120704 [Capitella teleta]|uniref:G-protein coupled receptors family 1 profile domain-containing protein n=1 Tax=Capitella teleta TaxID=283909 RepID=R7U749_CAPTE|nr:hypothetical protein CAPTEDRAFT_120704 [Capitella teleta]|eukprot:ELU01804.1 hypothetical protein CAPTEDRAFT_120704 [Capitella teleta]
MVCALIVVLVGIPGNLITILAYFKYDQLHSPTNLLICSQSIGDLFTCLTGPIFVVLNYTEIGQALASSNKYLCLAGLGMVLTSLQSSIINIMALGTERFIAVYFSLNYYNWVTDRNVKIAVVAIWTVVISINCLPVFGWNVWQPGTPCMSVNVYPQIFFQVLFIIPSMGCLLVCALGNSAIAFMAIRRQRAIAAAVMAPNSNQSTEEANIKSGNEFKVTKMLLLVVGCFYASWLPWITLNSIFFSLPSSWKKNGVPKGVLVAYEYSKTVLAANTLFNPFIYGWRNKLFRDAYYKLLGIRRSEGEP